MKSKIKNIAFTIWSLFNKNNKQNHLFLLAHPRSGSSLLMHILTTNNQIAGFGEYLTKYKTEKDLKKASFDIRRKSGTLFSKVTFVANQVNHQSVTPTIKLLQKETVKVIFLIRNPEETLSSIAVLSKNKNRNLSQKEITSIYTERLQNLIYLAKNLPKEKYCFLTYNELVNNSEKTLERLSIFLELKTPLSKKYRLKKFTQKWGDPSQNITRGTIFKTNPEKILFKKEHLDNAQKVYEEALLFFKSQKE